jgi:translation initiation factor 2 beta subunit (eIF-2beta)/eIF-5
MLNIHGKTDSSYRYKMPKVELRTKKNNKTYLTNLDKIAQSLNRKPDELIKWFSHNLGVSCSKKDGCINGQFDVLQIQDVLQKYIVEYVLCKVCGNPETTYVVSKKTMSMDCAACGGSSEMKEKTKFDKYLFQKLAPKKK